VIRILSLPIGEEADGGRGLPFRGRVPRIQPDVCGNFRSNDFGVGGHGHNIVQENRFERKIRIAGFANAI